MRKKKYQKMLLKNTLAIAIPAIAVFLVLVFLCIQYPIFDYIECKEIMSMENMDETLEGLYAAQTINVKLTTDTLKYTGLDYYEDGKQKGSYYYMPTNNRLILFLIKTDTPAPSYDAKSLKGTIVKDNVSSTYIMGQFADQAGIDKNILAGYCSDYIISEVGYPLNFIVMVYILFIAPIAISIIILMYTVYIRMNPQAHPQARQLSAYGRPGEIIQDINAQLANYLLYKKKNMYITQKYLIINYLSRTDVIKLDMVKYISKNMIERPKSFGRFYKKFRLTLSNPDTLFYEIDFRSEEVIDSVIGKIGIEQ